MAEFHASVAGEKTNAFSNILPSGVPGKFLEFYDSIADEGLVFFIILPSGAPGKFKETVFEFSILCHPARQENFWNSMTEFQNMIWHSYYSGTRRARKI